MQFHIPSVVQGPESAAPDPVVPVEIGLEAGAAGLGATEATGLAGAGAAVPDAIAEVTKVVGAAVAKTPPEGDGAGLEAAGDGATGAAAAEDCGADEPLPPAPPGQEPVGGAGLEDPRNSTESPGLGNCKSVESAVWQAPGSALILATNISGRALNAAVSLSMS